MIYTFKCLVVFAGLGLLLFSDTKTYEKDLKLNISLTQLGAFSDRGIIVSIQNLSAKNDHDISVVNQQRQNDSPLYVSFTGYMSFGDGKWEELPCKYRTPNVKDYPGGTKVQTVKAGKTTTLFSMMFSPSKMFLLKGIGSIKLVAHYKYLQKDASMGAEAAIPSFTLHSDTIVVNSLK